MEKTYSPREFMERRRPEKFSDSVIAQESKVNRSFLEYTLDSITNRNQERDFESFCVKLLQFEVCPNLRVQTGPVGGGDSKTDSENYPVSETTQFNCWFGSPNPKNDKWAFAISAKKDWGQKVKNDVKSVFSTKRPYKKVFFVTNQFAKDKRRAELEQSLSQEFGFEVIIFDRNWILDRVFANKREALAIEELRLGTGLEEMISIGPLDLVRSREFQHLNDLIETAISNDDISYAIINRAQETATLARAMGKPQTEVYGLFARAERLTKSQGSKEQLFTTVYQHAWTAYFWFEDFQTFVQLYDQAENIAKNTSNIFTVERLNNLCNLLRVISDQEDTIRKKFKTKIKNLKRLLHKFISEESRPSASLQARTMLLFNQLMDAPNDNVGTENCFTQLLEIMECSKGMIGFPYDSIATMVQELDFVYSDNPKYELLLNQLIEASSKRKGEIPQSVSLLRYGLKHLENGRGYKAIDYIGRAIIGLNKNESKEDFIKALYFISFAFERVGLLWAARGALLNAASFTTSDFWIYNDINTLQAKCYSRLKYIELQLGRVGYILEWHQLDTIISNQLATTKDEKDEVFKDTYYHFAMLVACLIVKTPKEKLPLLEKLPDVLTGFDLDFSAYGLLYLLNGQKNLPPEFVDHHTPEELNQLFSKWLDQPAQENLPPVPLFYEEETISLESNILGAEIVVKVPNSSPGIELAETLMASLESFLSTFMTHGAVSKYSRISIVLTESNELDKLVVFNKPELISKGIIIKYGKFNHNGLTAEQQGQIQDVLIEVIGYIVSVAIMIKDPKGTLNDILKKEKAVERSFSFLSALVTTSNVLGNQPKRSIMDWFKGNLTQYKYDPETACQLMPSSETTKKQSEIDVFDSQIISHKDVHTFSLINDHLWDKAKWKGTSFMDDPSTVPSHPPVLSLMFANKESGQEIFTAWTQEFGKEIGKLLDITILKGINKDEPFWYTMIVSTNPWKEDLESKRFVITSRMHTMTPSNSKNLDRFLNARRKTDGYYLLAPAYCPPNTFELEDVYFKLGVLLNKLTVKYAWEIGVHDLARVGISRDLDPFIPDNVKDAPVLQVLAERSKFSD